MPCHAIPSRAIPPLSYTPLLIKPQNSITPILIQFHSHSIPSCPIPSHLISSHIPFPSVDYPLSHNILPFPSYPIYFLLQSHFPLSYTPLPTNQSHTHTSTILHFPSIIFTLIFPLLNTSLLIQP
ncbi:hypothetical protein BDQ12DRAFT_730090 [Crucibulum laeve]|uniref:Uncharacterized protein n=1 Tax=Crucibulum laeve TaxID=68775 RepID=A0A5C3LDZ1_9AGAR|nr:hypothetical protein BDQ12DRAFT_730090 [Crucibulum laeve]